MFTGVIIARQLLFTKFFPDQKRPQVGIQDGESPLSRGASEAN